MPHERNGVCFAFSIALFVGDWGLWERMRAFYQMIVLEYYLTSNKSKREPLITLGCSRARSEWTPENLVPITDVLFGTNQC